MVNYFEEVMENVQDHSEGEQVTLCKVQYPTGDRWVIKAKNEGGYNCTMVDLVQLLDWIHKEHPEFLHYD